MGISKFRLRYTELINEEVERKGELILETKNITHSMESFSKNRNIIKMNVKQLNIKQ